MKTWYIMKAVKNKDDEVIATTNDKQNAMEIVIALCFKDLKDGIEKSKYAFTDIPPEVGKYNE